MYRIDGKYIEYEHFNDPIIEHASASSSITNENEFRLFMQTFKIDNKFIKLKITTDDTYDNNIVITLTNNDIHNDIANNIFTNHVPAVFTYQTEPETILNNILNDAEFTGLNCGQQVNLLAYLMEYICIRTIIKLKDEILDKMSAFKIALVDNVMLKEYYESFGLTSISHSDKSQDYIDKLLDGTYNDFENMSVTIFGSLTSPDAAINNSLETKRNLFVSLLEDLRINIFSDYVNDNLVNKINKYINMANQYKNTILTNGSIDVEISTDAGMLAKKIYKCQFISESDFSKLAIVDGTVYTTTESTTPDAASVVI